MTENLRQLARRLFLELAELPEAEGSTALARVCGENAALRAEVEALLRADRAAGAFLANPTAAGARASAAGAVAATTEQAGALIGRYKLLEQIGEGGMGTIWMAEQREPVKRRVALKIIKLGMDTLQVIARFEAERQALAMMDHPNIAKVFDAGATDAGRPYFVMEYIRGIPILEYCDKEKVDTKARLELFTSVCHAIQHAHQKGIIHRDIKPSNVLVTLHDGVPVCKVIDFGIAKATNAELTTKTLFTEHKQMVGTPAYMSPEQAELSGLDIDTRSDIYSLGVLLYELLTGTTPFDIKDLMAKGFAEMMRTIREDEPHKPSTRISSLGDTGTRTALQRHVDVKKLGTLLRGDIDWIVMKCLEKDRSRRYETANGLAADIKRHLRDEPVTAGAPSAGYKLRKFVKRNRAQVTAGCVVVMALLLGVMGTTGGMLWANRERDRANDAKARATLAAASEAEAKVEAQQNAQKAIAAARRAEAAKEEEAKARTRAETISEFVTTALKASDAQNTGGGQDVTVLQAMKNAIADIGSGRFAGDPETEAGLKTTIGTILQNNGRLAEAEPLCAQALETWQRLFPGDHHAVALGLNNLAHVREALGHATAAEPLFKKALEMSRRLTNGDDEVVALSLNNLAFVRQSLGRAAEAEPLYAESLEMNRRLFENDHEAVALGLNNLAGVRLLLGRAAEAEPLLVEALAMWQRLHPGDHPTVANGLANVAGVLLDLGRPAEAEPLHMRALEMQRRLFQGDHPDVGQSLDNLALVRFRLGRLDEAERLYTEVLEMRQRLFQGDHPDVAKVLTSLAAVREKMGRAAEAERLCTQSLEMYQRLFKGDHPDLLTTKGTLAVTYWSQGKLDKSIPLFEQVLEAQEAKLGRLHPDTLRTVANLGVNYKDVGRLTEAIPLLGEASRAAKKYPELVFVIPLLLEAHAKAADPTRPGDAARVVALLPQVLADARGALQKDSLQLAVVLAAFSVTMLKLEAWNEAEPLIRECLTIREAKEPNDWKTFHSRSQLGGAFLGQKKLAEAEPLLLAGYRGMKEREATIEPGGKTRIPEALERLVHLYETKGNELEASAWRVKLVAARSVANKPAANGGK